MRKLLYILILSVLMVPGYSQILVTVGSALLQTPGSEIRIPVFVKGLDAATGGVPVSGMEFHIRYDNTSLLYDTTLNFSALTPVSQWFFSGNGIEYATNWVEPGIGTINIPDNTVLFEMVFQYQGGITELIFDSAACLLLDVNYNEIPGVHYKNGLITPAQGSGDSRWNGIGPWNTVANWSNGIPGDSTNAIIESGETTISSNASCKSLNIQSGTTVIVAPNQSLTIHKDYLNNGLFHLQSDVTGTGSLITSGQISGSGENRFNQFLGFQNGFPYLVSSPVTQSQASAFGQPTVEKYLETGATWQALPMNEALVHGNGYRISGTSGSTAQFIGAFTNLDMTLTGLSYTNSVATENRGLNLLGNPFTSAIQWELGNWQRTNLDYAVYVWDGYKFLSWNGLVGSLKDGILPAMQGFFVKANGTGASLTIPAGSRMHSAIPFYKEAESISNLISMKVENVAGDGYYDETFVNIRQGATSGYDGQYDAVKLTGNTSYPQIYTLASSQEKLSIDTRADFGQVAVEFQVGIAGSYKILFKNIETFESSQPLYFEDKQTNTVINIRNSNEFVFSTDVLTQPGRLVLHFQEVGLKESSAPDFRVWCSGDACHVVSDGGSSAIREIALCNLTGQPVFQAAECVMPYKFAVHSEWSGLYILRVKTDEGIFTRKLFLSGK